MSIIAIDLGGTKLAAGLFSQEGEILSQKEIQLEARHGKAVGALIKSEVQSLLKSSTDISGIGISVPGISNHKNGTVWAPNIPGWDNYHLLEEVSEIAPTIAVSVESDRTCYILGEVWKGNATGCTDAIFIAVGTGIGAGILSDGRVIHGSNDIAGAIGWMALQRPWMQHYRECGCYEYNASGNGIAKVARDLLKESPAYSGNLRDKSPDLITAHDVFDSYNNGDALAKRVIDSAIEFWGMAVANLVSIFNPQKVIMGGGVFGPAVKFIPAIKTEMLKWAQPISAQQVEIVPSMLGASAGLYGAGYIALQASQENKRTHV